MFRPKIAITCGDVAGIGPEVIVRACADPEIRDCCRPVVVGHPKIIKRAVALIEAPLDVVAVPGLEVADVPDDVLPCWNPSGDDVLDVPAGQLDARAGSAAYEYLQAATVAVLEGRADAVTTAPLNKAALHLAGRNYPGHTEILAEICGVNRFAMMLYLPQQSLVKSPHGLGVAHVTLHTSIASVPGLLSVEMILERIELIDRFLRTVGCERPRVGVCALNPHAGEDGLFGNEEARLIAPAVAQACAAGIEAAGPFPADTLMKHAFDGRFDGIVAMYHDQGHIAVKLMGFDQAVNITLGLPIVRTSPSHGTAFDIAWQGQARADGMREALRVAALLAQKRERNTVGSRPARDAVMPRGKG